MINFEHILEYDPKAADHQAWEPFKRTAIAEKWTVFGYTRWVSFRAGWEYAKEHGHDAS